MKHLLAIAILASLGFNLVLGLLLWHEEISAGAQGASENSSEEEKWEQVWQKVTDVEAEYRREFSKLIDAKAQSADAPVRIPWELAMEVMPKGLFSWSEGNLRLYSKAVEVLRIDDDEAGTICAAAESLYGKLREAEKSRVKRIENDGQVFYHIEPDLPFTDSVRAEFGNLARSLLGDVRGRRLADLMMNDPLLQGESEAVRLSMVEEYNRFWFMKEKVSDGTHLQKTVLAGDISQSVRRYDHIIDVLAWERHLKDNPVEENVIR